MLWSLGVAMGALYVSVQAQPADTFGVQPWFESVSTVLTAAIFAAGLATIGVAYEEYQEGGDAA